MRASRQRKVKLQRSCGRRHTTEPKAGYRLAGPRGHRGSVRASTGLERGQIKPHRFFVDGGGDF